MLVPDMEIALSHGMVDTSVVLPPVGTTMSLVHAVH
jgi:hypothetical protein